MRRQIPDLLRAMRVFCELDPNRVIFFWERLHGYLWRTGHFWECRECESYALVAVQRVGGLDPERRAMLLGRLHANLSFDQMELGELKAAEAHSRAAETQFRCLDDGYGVATVLRFRANILCRRGELGVAEQVLTEALRELDRADGRDARSAARESPSDAAPGVLERGAAPAPDPGEPADTSPGVGLVERSKVHTLLGWIYGERGERAAAWRELLKAWNAVRRLRRPDLALAPLQNLARLFEEMANDAGQQGRTEEEDRYFGKARWCFRRCCELTGDETNLDIRAPALFGMARMAEREGQIGDAIGYAEESARICEQLHKYRDGANARKFADRLRRVEAGYVGDVAPGR